MRPSTLSRSPPSGTRACAPSRVCRRRGPSRCHLVRLRLGLDAAHSEYEVTHRRDALALRALRARRSFLQAGRPRGVCGGAPAVHRQAVIPHALGEGRAASPVTCRALPWVTLKPAQDPVGDVRRLASVVDLEPPALPPHPMSIAAASPATRTASRSAFRCTASRSTLASPSPFRVAVYPSRSSLYDARRKEHHERAKRQQRRERDAPLEPEPSMSDDEVKGHGPYN